jgi:DNA-binding MarR family transcriptional regulator
MTRSYLCKLLGIKLPPAQDRVLSTLIYDSGQDGRARVRVSTMAKWIGYSQQHINAALRELQRDGLIEEIPTRSSSREFQLYVECAWPEAEKDAPICEEWEINAALIGAA